MDRNAVTFVAGIGVAFQRSERVLSMMSAETPIGPDWSRQNTLNDLRLNHSSKLLLEAAVKVGELQGIEAD